MFSWQTTEGHYHLNPDFLTMLAIGAVFAFITLTGFGQKMEQQAFAPRFGNKALVAASFFSAVLFVFCLSSITTSGFKPFIYFRF